MKKIILLIILFAVFALRAEALSYRTLNRNSIDGTYAYYYDSTLGRDKYLQAEKYNFDSYYAFCLEFGKEITTNHYAYDSSFESLNIDENILNKIKLIVYYGYNYPGHAGDEYYLATQELIWKEMNYPAITWVKDLTPSLTVDITREKEEIMFLVNTHNLKPSFDGTTIEKTPGEEIIIEDENNVLNRYKSDNDKVSIKGNKLIIAKDFDGDEITLRTENYLPRDFYLFRADDSQKMIVVGGVDEKTSKIKVEITKGSLEIHKLDKDNKTNTPSGEGTLNGAVYELFSEDGVLVGTFTIGKKEKIDNLPLGTYTLKEKEPSKGYTLDKNTYKVEITGENLNVSLDVYEEVIKRKIEVFKVFASSETGILTGEAGVKFEIYDCNGKLVDTITTDSEGYASLILPYGTYTFKQITVTENYHKVEDFTVEVSNSDERPIHKLISNSPVKAKLKVIKKDADTGENILNSKIKFKIYDVKNKKYVSFKMTYPENRVVEEFQVDKNGIFITPEDLLPGDYILYEIDENMDGYLYNSKAVKFTIGTSSDFIEEDGELLLEIPFYNKRAKGKITIIKYGEKFILENDNYHYKNILFEGVKFGLYAKEDIYENNKLIYSKDSLVKELITGKDGTVSINNLPLGKYYLKEISTVEGNTITDTVYDIDLSYVDQYTALTEYTLTINNYLPKGNLVIYKYEKGSKKPLSDTLIEIRTIDNQVVYKGYTDINGMITLENLPYGKYYLSEIEASTGYHLLEDDIYFNIEDKEVKIEVYNERIEVPNTGISDKVIITISILIVLTILFTIIFIHRKSIIIIGTIVIFIIILFLGIYMYNYYHDYKSNKDSIGRFMSKEEVVSKETKYQYRAILEVPSVNIKRGILDINSQYNKAKYNVELVKETDNLIVLAAHNGSSYNSYFSNLHKIELGDEINYYFDGKIYKYIYSDHYEIKKNGYADIFYDEEKKTIALITCKENSNDAQVVYIGYLREVKDY